MGFPEFLRLFCRCWKPSFSGETSTKNGDSSGRSDGLLWYKDAGCHVSGDYSIAVIQANNLLEDHCHLHSSTDMPQKGTFVGVFDGHGGPEASRYVCDHLFTHIKRFSSENGGVSSEVIRLSYMATEEGFLALVRDQWAVKPQIASVGTCCLVAILSNGYLYVANAGDSRAVLGRVDKAFNDYKAIQLSVEHNASEESVRQELRSLHPNDPHIVVLKHKVWRVKGLIQVSRSIGDAYLKRAEFNKEPLLPKFRLPRIDAPILRADPAITEHKLCAEDKFVILASDGLWEHVTNEEAVDIVKSSPRNGVARKLLRVALQEAAKKREMRYSDLKKIERGIRRHFHDDITIVVLFIDSHLPT